MTKLQDKKKEIKEHIDSLILGLDTTKAVSKDEWQNLKHWMLVYSYLEEFNNGN